MKATFLMFLLAMGIQSAMAQELAIRLDVDDLNTSTAGKRSEMQEKFGKKKSYQNIVNLMMELKKDEDILKANVQLNKRLKAQGIEHKDTFLELRLSSTKTPVSNFDNFKFASYHSNGAFHSRFNFFFEYVEDYKQNTFYPHSRLNIRDALFESGAITEDTINYQEVSMKDLEKEEVYKAVRDALKREILKHIDSFGREDGSNHEFSLKINEDDRNGKARVNVPASENDSRAKAQNI